MTIPITVLAGFVFFGLLSLGEEIEDPFGYDRNDLNLDFFCQDIVSVLLRLRFEAMLTVLLADP